MPYLALLEAYPTVYEARRSLVERDDMPADVPYVGIWEVPLPERTRVHVFTAHTSEQLLSGGWVRCPLE
jgi:hypothetical protein